MRTLGAVYVGIAVLYLVLPSDGASRTWIGAASLTLAPAAALGAALLARARTARGARVSWLLIALASGSALAGQLLWDLHELVHHRPVGFPSASFFLFVAFHPLLVGGILASLRSGRARRAGIELALDGALAWSVITLALLRLLFEPLRASAPYLGTAEQAYIVSGQIAVHGALVAAGVLIVWRDSVLPPRTVAALVGVALANSTANLLSLVGLDPDPGRLGDWFDLAWLAGWMLLIHAGIVGAERGTGQWIGTRAADVARRVRSAILPTSILVFGVIAADLAVRGRGTLPTIAALGIATVLIAARGAQALRSAEREEREREQLERTRGLVALSHSLAAAAGLDGALMTVCEWGRKLLAAESAWIEVPSGDGSMRARGYHAGHPVEAVIAAPLSVTKWLDDAATRQVCTGPEAAVLHGPGGDPLPHGLWVSAASIRFGDRRLGCLVVAQPDRPLDGTEAELLGALADQVAIAIENARLVEDARASERSRLHAEKLATIGQLVAGVAHEINNPLASIRSAADLLARDGRGEHPSSIRLIQEEAARAAGIVRGMLDFVHPAEIEVTAVSLDEVAAASLRLRAYEHSVRDIGVECDLSGLPPVRVDRNRLQQVLLNLIVNAEHAMAASSGRRLLRIHGCACGDTVTVHIADTGEGIRPQHLNRVFDPFFTTKTVGQGTGLGLSVSYGIVRELGGDITVASETGVGTTFTLQLPCANGAVEPPGFGHAPGGESHDDSDGQPGELDILLVDDEASLRVLLARFLRGAGHTVKLAGNGGEGLNALQGRSFDVIVTDLKMPDLDGPQFFRELAATRPELVDRVLFMSGDTVAPETRAFLESSGRPFIAKPFTLDAFAQHLTAVAREAGAAGEAPLV